MKREHSRPLDVYVRLVYTANLTRENMEVYRQKAQDSDEFVCVEQDQLPAGQHMIEFLSASSEKLPRLFNDIKKHFDFIQSHNFDHHLVPVHIEDIFDLYGEIRNIHPWWAACFPMDSLWESMNNYSFYSIHPSPYLIETYDEVDRLLDEESYWRDVMDRLQTYIQWFDAYIRHLRAFQQALACCLDAGVPEPLSSLSTCQKGFVFSSFFDDLFLHRSGVRLLINLQESYSSPLGRTVARSQILPPDEGRLQELEKNNMDFDAVFYEKSDPLQMESLVDMVKGKSVELTCSLLLQSAGDIYSVCAHSFYLLFSANTKVKKCKNCGEYFVPLNRSDELYCCRMQKNGKRCRELDYADKIDTDVLLSIYRTAYKTHNARKQRTKKNNLQAEQKFKEWVVFAKKLLDHAKAGELTVEEYAELIRK